MVDKDRLLQRLLATFLGELDDHAGAIERDLMALEKESRGAERAALFKTLFRSAHSLKGAAAAVGMGPIETACHRIEEIFGTAQAGGLQLSSDHFQLLLEATDALRDAGERIKAKKNFAGAPISVLIPRLEAAAGKPPPSKEAPAPPPSGAQPPSMSVPAPSGPAAAKGARFESSSDEAPRQETRRATTERAGEDDSIRIMADKLDSLSAQSGELLTARNRIRRRIDEIGQLQERARRHRDEWHTHRPNALSPKGGIADRTSVLDRLDRDLQGLIDRLSDDIKAIDRSSDSLDFDIRAMRLVPFEGISQGLERAVRDLCSTLGKKASIRIVGGDTEIDRSVLERLRDPLLHLVRNAIDHGIESPQERIAAGKPETGEIVVSVRLYGSMVEVAIADDGKGIDVGAVRSILSDRGEALADDDVALANSIFLPGFSTASKVTSLSGRGVGLDVVRSNIEALRGTVNLSFRPGNGTTFTLLVPMTLGTIRALTVRVADATIAINMAMIERLLRLSAEDISTVEGRQTIMANDAAVPLFSLGDRLSLKVRPADGREGRIPAVLLSVAGRRAAFVVDEFVDDREIVVGALGPRLMSVNHISGGTILEDGQVALVLNSVELVGGSFGDERRVAVEIETGESRGKPKKRLVVADDSVTTRTLEKNILESVGYEVLAAADGAEAWRLVQDGGVDLVVSDVEMPQMDGLSLTQTIRRSPQFRTLPVILVTALENEADKARGMEAGADAYLMKSSFDQAELIETIEQIIGEVK